MAAHRYLYALIACTLFNYLPLHNSSCCCEKDYAYGKTMFSARPQGNYYFTTLMATADITHRLESKENYVNCTAQFGYRQNMDTYELGRYFFTQTGPVIFGAVNTDVDIQNLQLGLANNYTGTLTMQPSVSDILVGLDFFVGFDKWVQGLWLDINLPFVRNSWCPCLQAQTAAAGALNYPAGFADIASVTVPVQYRSPDAAACGDYGFGIIPALSAGKLCCCTKTLWGLSDIHFELGYDFIRRSHGNIGIALIGAIGTGQPTGKSCNQYLLPPTIGTQNSSQLGVALRGQYDLFNFDDGKRITLYADGRVSHIFPGCTKRLLNWNVGNSTAFNYWLLLNHYDHNGTFVGVERAAHLLNKKVKVSATAMLEATCMIQTANNNWYWDLGYNFWFRSQENICMIDPTIGSASDYYTLKDTSTWGTMLVDKDVGNIAEQPSTGLYSARVLENIKKYALNTGNIDVCSAQHPRTFSNSFFAAAGYHFSEKRCDPFLNLGAHVEWGCGNLALNTWGLYLQGGISI